MVIFFKSKNVLLILPPKYGKFFVPTDFLLITCGKFFVLVDFYQLCFCHAPDDFFKAHLEAPSWFNIEMTKSCTACFFSTETKDDDVFQSLDQTETCTMIFLKGLGLAFMFTSVKIFPI